MLEALIAVCCIQVAGHSAKTTPRPTRLVRVTARFLDAAGRPLEGVGVACGKRREVTTRAALEEPVTRSGKDGRVSFNVRRDQPVSMIAAKAGHAAWTAMPATARRNLRMAGVAWDLGDVRLAKGVTVRGRVRTTTGDVLSNAVVLVQQPRHRFALTGHLASVARSARDGSFVLPCVAAHGALADIHARAHFSLHLPFVDVREPLDVKLDPSGVISGRVVASPRRVKRWRVYLDYENGQYEPARSLGRAGRFELTIERRGRCRVVVIGEDQLAVATSDILTGPRKNLFLSPLGDRGITLFVRAKDKQSGKAVKAFEATALWGIAASLGMYGRQDREFERSDAEGVAKVTVAETAKDVSIFARAPGYAWTRIRNVQVGADFDRDVMIELLRESVVRGRVLEAGSNRPISGAVVAVGGNGPPTLVKSSRDGSFSSVGLAARSYRIETLHEGALARVRIRLGVGETKRDVELRLPPAKLVRGRIKRSNPLPADAFLAFGWTPIRSAGRGISPPGCAIDSAGRFSTRYRGSLSLDELFIQYPTAPLTGWRELLALRNLAAADSDRLELEVLATQRARFSGKVEFGRIKAPPGRIVVAAAPSKRNGASADPIIQHQWKEGSRLAWLDAAGNYTLETPRGEWTLSCRDIVSGVELAQVKRRAKGGERLRVDFALDLAIVDVSLPDLLGHELRIGDRRPGGGAPDNAVYAGGRLLDGKFALHASTRDVSLYLPAGEWPIHVLKGWTFGDGASKSRGGEPSIASTKITTEAGKQQRVVLRTAR